jgi:shikimate dehydrogenase
MQGFGLIGKTLSHSFSKSYFEAKFEKLGLEDHTYDLFEIGTIELFGEILEAHPDLKGLNVTIPYKEQIIPFLDELSAEAKAVGAVNCISIQNNKLVGYNTDVYGFSQSIKPFLDNNHQRALILGTGGASKAIAYALNKVGVEFYFVTSSEKKKTINTFFYSEMNALMMRAFKLIVNTTPLGTFPGVNECPPLPYEFFTPEHLAYDLVYNPAETLFLKQAKAQGAITVNGLSMLQLQAEKSWEIWSSG